MGEIFSHECERIYLLGGEPLLHPEIITLIKIARENFTRGNIYIFTNGILLPKQSDEFWKTCHDNSIEILISAYPITIDTVKIREQGKNFRVNIRWAWNQEEKSRNIFGIHPVNLNGNCDATFNFIFCERANECISLSHGRLFTCTFIPNVRHFNKKFSQHIMITDRDSVDIYEQDISPEYILKKMSEPVQACRYCNMTAKAYRKFKWGITKGDIHEYI